MLNKTPAFNVAGVVLLGLASITLMVIAGYRNVHAQLDGTKIRVEGLGPFSVKIYNEPEWANTDQISRYVDTRRDALKRLSVADPDRNIEVSVSPNEYLTVENMWRLAAHHGLEIDEITVNFFLNGQYHGVMGMGASADEGEEPLIDLAKPADVVEARLRKVIPPTTLARKGIDADDLQVRISWARGTITAQAAAELDSGPEIMLVDPIADLVDAHAWRALDVKVVDVPQLLTEKRLIEGSSSL